jgi:hypothetical protein
VVEINQPWWISTTGIGGSGGKLVVEVIKLIDSLSAGVGMGVKNCFRGVGWVRR